MRIECGDEIRYFPGRFVLPGDEDHTLHIESVPGNSYTESREQLYERLGLTAIVREIKGKR